MLRIRDYYGGFGHQSVINYGLWTRSACSNPRRKGVQGTWNMFLPVSLEGFKWKSRNFKVFEVGRQITVAFDDN